MSDKCGHPPGSKAPLCQDCLDDMVADRANLRTQLAEAKEELRRLRGDLATASATILELRKVEGRVAAFLGAVPNADRQPEWFRNALADLSGEPRQEEASGCHHSWEWDRSCGARVCAACGEHKGLARCFCGWNRAGDGLGREELREMGEVVDEEEG